MMVTVAMMKPKAAAPMICVRMQYRRSTSDWPEMSPYPTLIIVPMVQ